MRFHWQNLNDRVQVGERCVTGWPKSGRCWLYIGKKTLRFEWSLGLRFGAHLEFDPDEREIQVNLAPLFGSFFWSIEGVKLPGKSTRTTGFSCHDWRMSAYILADRDNWSRDDPWWQRWSFDIKDVLLGRRNHNLEVLEPKRETWIPMPEGPYRAAVELERRTWKRSRWPWWPCTIRRDSYAFDIPHGIPFSGKGENCWDCGEDGLYGCGYSEPNEALAIGRLVGTVLEYRKKRGDGMLKPWPVTPAQREIELDKRRAAASPTTEQR